MTPDYTKAAIKAAETLIKYGVKTAPVSPLPILEAMDNVMTKSFLDICNHSGLQPCELKPLFGKGQDALSSIHTENGKTWYVVAYNSLLPFNIIQRALAREMGHIVLKHEGSSPENTAEAVCFAHHLLCPRPLIHTIQATGMKLTKDKLANLTGVFDQCLKCIRHTPGVSVPASTNRFIRGQFMPFVMNFVDYYTTVMPEDGSAIADLGTYMDLYEE